MHWGSFFIGVAVGLGSGIALLFIAMFVAYIRDGE